MSLVSSLPLMGGFQWIQVEKNISFHFRGLLNYSSTVVLFVRGIWELTNSVWWEQFLEHSFYGVKEGREDNSSWYRDITLSNFYKVGGEGHSPKGQTAEEKDGTSRRTRVWLLLGIPQCQRMTFPSLTSGRLTMSRSGDLKAQFISKF